MDNNRLLALLNKHKDNTCTQQESEELEQWYKLLNTGNQFLYGSDSDAVSAEMLNQFKRKLADKAVVIPFYRSLIFRVAAVASIIILLGVGNYFELFNNSKQNDVVKTNPSAADDVKAPVATKATITLANGKVVLLDSINTGTLAKQGNVNVTKTTDGQIIYTGATSQITYNTLTNPRGSKVVNLKLSDGTKVWLNSESSLKYPVAFAGNERKVTITGEAYFEVAKDAGKHFFVDASGVITEVLGTHFNVNSYSNEASTKITLLEGSVKVTKGAATSFLKPSQQAQCSYPALRDGGGIKVIEDINTEEVMAWKEGKFQFGDKADIASVMRQIARWYDVEVTYQGTVSGHIGGGISRDVNASQVFKMLEATGAAKFVIEGQKVIVSPQ